MSHAQHRPVPVRRLPLYPGNGRICTVCHGSGTAGNCPECGGWDDEPEDESAYCTCDLEATIEEADTGQCDCCGKPLP